MDGQREVLEVDRLQKLAANTGWRKQLAALQGCVIVHRVEYGVYCANEDVSTDDGGIIERPYIEHESSVVCGKHLSVNG